MIPLIRFYQLSIRPTLPKSCRYTPSCSQYALECFQHYPFFKAFYWTLRRIWSCRPGGGQGYDPIPLKKTAKK